MNFLMLNKKILLFGCVMAILVHFAGCGKKVETTEFVRPIKSMKVGDLVSDTGKHYSGVAKSTTEANLSFRVAGEIIELPVKTGDEVQKDKILALYKEKQTFEKPSAKRRRIKRELIEKQRLSLLRDVQMANGEWDKIQKKKEEKRYQRRRGTDE